MQHVDVPQILQVMVKNNAADVFSTLVRASP